MGRTGRAGVCRWAEMMPLQVEKDIAPECRMEIVAVELVAGRRGFGRWRC
jgi:hypothetical protein